MEDFNHTIKNGIKWLKNRTHGMPFLTYFQVKVQVKTTVAQIFPAGLIIMLIIIKQWKAIKENVFI